MENKQNIKNSMTSSVITDSLIENSLETVSRNLSAARVGMGLSQDQLAEAAGVSRATIVQLEGGAGDPRLSTITAIAGALNITPMFLLLSSNDLQAIANVAKSEEAAQFQGNISEKSLEDMQRLLRSGLTKNRNKAIAIGTAATNISGGATTVSVNITAAAAIGSVLLPGVGTVIGAALGLLLNRVNSKKENKD